MTEKKRDSNRSMTPEMIAVFSRRMRELREAAGLNRNQVAAGMGIVSGKVGAWEAAKKGADWVNATRAARFFGVTLDHLVLGAPMSTTAVKQPTRVDDGGWRRLIGSRRWEELARSRREALLTIDWGDYQLGAPEALAWADAMAEEDRAGAPSTVYSSIVPPAPAPSGIQIRDSAAAKRRHRAG